MTVASSSTTIRSNDRSAASNSVARTRCLPDPTVGAEHWAVVASLVETCKLNDVDPLAYLADVLTRIVSGHPNRDIDQLLPWAYRTQFLKAVA